MTRQDERSFFDDDADPAGSSSASSTRALTQQYLIFSVTGLEMALPLEHVSEILPYEHVSDLPGKPEFINGVVHVRGRVTPVVDLAVKLGRPALHTTNRTCILMIEVEVDAERLPFGIVVDGVATLMDVDTSTIRKPPRLGTSVDVRYVDGLVQTPRGMLPLIDVSRMLARSELEGVRALREEDPSNPA
jgi:purine-binding chemotaxis protein CheW